LVLVFLTFPQLEKSRKTTGANPRNNVLDRDVFIPSIVQLNLKNLKLIVKLDRPYF